MRVALHSRTAWTVLVLGHVAGQIDMGALPVWMGTLVQGFAFSPSQAGGLVTLFLISMAAASLILSPFYHRINARALAPAAFWFAAIGFFLCAQVTDFAMLAILHVFTGFAAGLGMSLTHGVMGRSSNPHRLFAYAMFAVGVAALLFLGISPHIIEAFGPAMIFYLFSAVIAIAAIAQTLRFPAVNDEGRDAQLAPERHKPARFDLRVWLAISGILLMALNQSMIFSFIERIGSDREFGKTLVQTLLVAVGFVSLVPSLLAATLETRLSPVKVAIGGAVLQAVAAYMISTSTGVWLYFLPAAFFSFIMLFTHTFVFGYLAKIEPTGRAVAATPAMIMSGSALGPFIGGVLSEAYGYAALGATGAIIGLAAACSFYMSLRAPQKTAAPAI